MTDRAADPFSAEPLDVHSYDPVRDESDDLETSRPEVILSAALHLMSAYSRDGGCARLAHIILRHLETIAERRDVAPVVRQTCAQLVEEWERLLQNAAPPRRSPVAGMAKIIRLRPRGR